MSMDDDLVPNFPGGTRPFGPVKVETLSIAELKEYIEHAKSEIARAETEIRNKEALRGDAAALFKK